MKHLLLVAAVLVAAVTSAFADVTIKSNIVGKGPGMGGPVTSVTYVKGAKMRTETVTGDTTRVSILDVDGQKMYVLDTTKKEVDVYDMKQLSDDMSKHVQVSDMKTSLKANGQTKQIAGKAASGYDMEVSIPATMGGEKGMKMVVTVLGPVWIVKAAPGTQEYMAFYKNAINKGWFFADPRQAMAQPGQARAMAEMYRQIAATGGIPYEQEMTVKISGEGQMAAAFAKMGNISMTTTVTSVETAALAADLFAVPAGYKVKGPK
jgi:hypothetical protein